MNTDDIVRHPLPLPSFRYCSPCLGLSVLKHKIRCLFPTFKATHLIGTPVPSPPNCLRFVGSPNTQPPPPTKAHTIESILVHRDSGLTNVFQMQSTTLSNCHPGMASRMEGWGATDSARVPGGLPGNPFSC